MKEQLVYTVLLRGLTSKGIWEICSFMERATIHFCIRTKMVKRLPRQVCISYFPFKYSFKIEQLFLLLLVEFCSYKKM